MDVNVVRGKNYGDIPRFWGRKNKANFKDIVATEGTEDTEKNDRM